VLPSALPIYHLVPEDLDNFPALSDTVFEQVLRTDWAQPGFCILVLPEGTGSKTLRQLMVRLKESLSTACEARWGESLEYLSLGRFDQQTTTKLHLDGAPETSLLMLGYEPTTVHGTLHIADYSRCARDLGLTPADFLQQHNPMFPGAVKLLEPYTTSLNDWHEHSARIVLINNSHTPPGTPQFSPGVMHGATILTPDPAATRIINSTMIAPRSFAGEDAVTKQVAFLETANVSGLI